jgi:hypothetical protein
MQSDKPPIIAPSLKYRLFVVLYDSLLFKSTSASRIPGKDNGNGRHDVLINMCVCIIIKLTNKCTNINYFIVFISVDVFPYTCFGP